jgi:hypothetical protein
MKDVVCSFDHDGDEMTVTVTDDGDPVFEMKVTEYGARGPAGHNYMCFTVDPEDRYKVNILMEAEHSEHEEESGSLMLHPHPMTEGLDIGEVNSYPFREEWYRKGLQTFDPMVNF